MINDNFYPLTPGVAKKLRASSLTAAEWRIWSYLIEIEPWGDRYQDFNTLVLLDECDVSKATFYRAIAKFQELEIFDFQDNGFSIRNIHGVSSLKNEKVVSKMRQDSQNCESRLKNEKPVAKMRQDSQKCESQDVEPLQSKDSKSLQSIQIESDLKDTTEEEANCCVLEKFEDKLKVYGIHLYIFDEKSEQKNLAGFGISPNPKIATIREIINQMPQEKAERAIAAYLAWLPTAKNVRCKYAALASSLRENWES